MNDSERDAFFDDLDLSTPREEECQSCHEYYMASGYSRICPKCQKERDGE
jgi:Zn finger protein HypA/HybF involved in hydrogenase expression